MTVSVQYAYLAMTLAEELDIRSLRGIASLEVMQKTVVTRRTKVDDLMSPSTSILTSEVGSNALEGDVNGEGGLVLTSAQQLRLLSGYYRLTRTWERVRSAPPSFDHTPSCGANWHQQGCTQSWLDFWKDKTKADSVLSIGPADIVSRLKQVQKEYDKWGSAPYMHHECRNSARKVIQEVIKKVEEALPDFFSDD